MCVKQQREDNNGETKQCQAATLCSLITKWILFLSVLLLAAIQGLIFLIYIHVDDS